MGTRGRRPARSLAEVFADERAMGLLAAVADGRVLRGADGLDEAVNAPYFLEGRSVRLSLRQLARDELVVMPMSGPPRLWGEAAEMVADWKAAREERELG